MDYQKIIGQLKVSSGLTWGELAAVLGYSKGQKVMDIARGMESMSGPAQMCLAYFLTIKDKPKLLDAAIARFQGKNSAQGSGVES